MAFVRGLGPGARAIAPADQTGASALVAPSASIDRLSEPVRFGLWEADLVTGAVRWSAMTPDILRLAVCEPALEAIVTAFDPQAQGKIRDAIAAAASDGQPWDMDLPMIQGGNQQRWVRAVGWAMLLNDKPTRLIGLFRDISIEVSERRVLLEFHERLEMATKGCGIGIWEWDIIHNRLTWDERMYKLYGTQPSGDMEPYSVWVTHLHPDDKAAAERASKAAADGSATFDTEFRVIWDDGSVHHVRGAGLVSRDAAGQAMRMIGSNWDITASVQAESLRIEREIEATAAAASLERAAHELSQMNAISQRSAEVQRGHDRFRAAVQAVQGVLWTNDAAGRMAGEQPGWAMLTGQTLQQYQGYGWADAVHPEDAQPTVDAWNEAVAECRTFVFEHRVRRQDGAWRNFAIRAIPMLDRETKTILEWVGVHTDITEQRQAEAALQALNGELEARVHARTAELEKLTGELTVARDAAQAGSRAKSRFLAGMSHELRTPLNGILGYARMLRLDGGLTATQGVRVDAMLGAGNHLLKMINTVLDMSEIEAEKMHLQLSEVDLQDLAAECLDVVGATAEENGLSMNFSIMRGAPRRLLTDPMRLRQVLLNLLGNAVKFTQQGSIELRVRPSQSGGVRIEIADTGPGIAEPLRERLFRDFERLDRQLSATTEGSGLGLALSARLTDLIGGKIGHQPNPAGGSVFWLELPVAIGESNTPTAETPARAGSPGPRRLRVLVADDMEINRDIARSFLASANHEVVCAAGGAEAVEAALQADFDVIAMDVRMPGVDGLEATRRIRKFAGPRGRVPILALTAQAFAEQVTLCVEAGMNGHLSKPYTVEGLLDKVATLAAMRRD